MLQYNQTSYLWAKKVLLPQIQRAEDMGVFFSVPDTLRLVATLLLNRFDNMDEWHYTDKFAFSVMSSFQKHLDVMGYYEFGEDDIMKLVPDKYLDGVINE